jgi:hypothetical protein
MKTRRPSSAVAQPRQRSANYSKRGSRRYLSISKLPSALQLNGFEVKSSGLGCLDFRNLELKSYLSGYEHVLHIEFSIGASSNRHGWQSASRSQASPIHWVGRQSSISSMSSYRPIAGLFQPIKQRKRFSSAFIGDLNDRFQGFFRKFFRPIFHLLFLPSGIPPHWLDFLKLLSGLEAFQLRKFGGFHCARLGYRKVAYLTFLGRLLSE